MHTKVIDRLESMRDFSGLRVRMASRWGSPIRRFKDFIELSDWEDRILQREREIDAFCWVLAGGAGALLLPVSFLVMKGLTGF